ncbi:hypothetical protein SAMN02910398_03927 [Butyrivibrio sp. YAB3001]|nr:hypothetical protein SAMN02910398_03927 [Butyrivibrio sp. YAB3001]
MSNCAFNNAKKISHYSPKIIDTVKFNGRYIDSHSFWSKIKCFISISIVLGIIVFVCAMMH